MPILDILVIVSLRLRLSQISADFNLRNASRWRKRRSHNRWCQSPELRGDPSWEIKLLQRNWAQRGCGDTSAVTEESGMMLVAGFLNTVCTLSIGHSSYQCLQCRHYCDYRHPPHHTVNHQPTWCPLPRPQTCRWLWPPVAAGKCYVRGKPKLQPIISFGGENIFPARKVGR